MYCQKCGLKLEDDWKCCPKCVDEPQKIIIVKNEGCQNSVGYFSKLITILLLIIIVISIIDYYSSRH